MTQKDKTAEGAEVVGETDADGSNPVMAAVDAMSTQSAIAVAGHPLHAMSVHFPIALVYCTLGIDILYWWGADAFWLRVGVWSAGGAFVAGVGAALIGTVELLLVAGIRARAASWAHGIAAMTLVAIMGANWLLRLVQPDAILPHGLALSVMAAIVTAIAGWHGGKLIFDHGVGLMISPKD